ncbi:hypothetical protein NEUTE1DRAFT_113990 [Neurospora tetrasperma FGSC 2508]|uniref:Uncharacterized protein n=1 Tax=Neurospora tetrasperma (strain FGSC 2508 / ATCC MYA-4615 / P0657) TaxID=510951 RepID=F8MYW8_NEUT8|nr:uncharacterized protein NEUTE1DRAFT_113990 [Neurospora tetrasperma FGSC 2508]EGO51966.1 hypothetical protein NEUTE1DRAFT_113990 [Neurospora tetrasperma FGSC 2508]
MSLNSFSSPSAPELEGNDGKPSVNHKLQVKTEITQRYQETSQEPTPIEQATAKARYSSSNHATKHPEPQRPGGSGSPRVRCKLLGQRARHTTCLCQPLLLLLLDFFFPATPTTTISSPSLIPSSSSAAAATTQKQQLQPLDVTHSVISNFGVIGTDAIFVGYTTPTGATEGVLSVPSPSSSPSPSVSKPPTRPGPDSEPEGESKSGAPPIGKTTAQVTAGQNTVTAILITCTSRARNADFTPREKQDEDKEVEEAAKKRKIRKQTAASYSVCAKWLREQMEDLGRAKARREGREENR